MFFKTLIAAIFAAILAGGMVYFGTASEQSAGSVRLEAPSLAEPVEDALPSNPPKSSLLKRYIGNPKEDVSSEPQHSSDNEITGSENAVSRNQVETRIVTVAKQADRISQIELRDQAYLDLADYAAENGMFEDAISAAMNIQQDNLRDTSRSRIAVNMARTGQAEAAFALIDEVEIEELKDVMRLQVIEALLGSDRR